jgi:hypothetical protein
MLQAVDTAIADLNPSGDPYIVMFIVDAPATREHGLICETSPAGEARRRKAAASCCATSMATVVQK